MHKCASSRLPQIQSSLTSLRLCPMQSLAGTRSGSTQIVTSDLASSKSSGIRLKQRLCVDRPRRRSTTALSKELPSKSSSASQPWPCRRKRTSFSLTVKMFHYSRSTRFRNCSRLGAVTSRSKAKTNSSRDSQRPSTKGAKTGE